MAEANNPYVVNLLEFNEDDGIPYMVLEFVAGDSLGQLLQERTRLGENEALSFMAAVARGLMDAHERGIVHRDIKPSNILLLEPRTTQPVGVLDEPESSRASTETRNRPGTPSSQPGPRPAITEISPRSIERKRPGRGSRSRTSGWPGTSSIPNRSP